MNSRSSRLWTRLCRSDTATNMAGGLLQSRREQSPASEYLGGQTPLDSKRQSGGISEIDQLSVKRARLLPVNAQRPETRNEKAEQTGVEQISLETLLRKRKIDNDDGDDIENVCRPKQARLTRKNLALFNKMGNRKETNKTSVQFDSTAESSKTTTSTTTSGFAIKVKKNGILIPCTSRPPANLEEINNYLARSRRTPSPTESKFRIYVKKVSKAGNEASMLFEGGSRLLKTYTDGNYERGFDRAFSGFPKNVGFNNGLSAPQPDFVEGLDVEEFDSIPIDEHIKGAVLFKDDPSSITLPHVAGEWKGRGKDMEEARLQSAYDGAALVYARNQALAYVQSPDPADHAEVMTFTTDGTNINFFAHYASPSQNGALKYHQYPLVSAQLRNTYEDFKQGRRQLRNVQDHAREASYALRDKVKGHWEQLQSDTYPIVEESLDSGREPPGMVNTCEGKGKDKSTQQQPYELTPPSSSRPEGHSKSDRNPGARSSSSKSHPSKIDSCGGRRDQKRKVSLSQGSSRGSSHGSSRHESVRRKVIE